MIICTICSRLDEWVPLSRFNLSTLQRCLAETDDTTNDHSTEHSSSSGKRHTRSADPRSKRDGRRRASTSEMLDGTLLVDSSTSHPIRGGGNFHSDLAELEAG